MHQIAMHHIERPIHAQRARWIPHNALHRMLDHIFYGIIDEFTPCNWIPATGHTIVDFHVARFIGGRAPGARYNQIDNNIHGHHVTEVILLADDCAEEAIADGRYDAGRTIPIVQPSRCRFIEACDNNRWPHNSHRQIASLL